jgi:hypothetical protein
MQLSNTGVYLFDEFDSIGSQRGLTNDAGEIAECSTVSANDRTG